MLPCPALPSGAGAEGESQSVEGESGGLSCSRSQSNEGSTARMRQRELWGFDPKLSQFSESDASIQQCAEHCLHGVNGSRVPNKNAPHFSNTDQHCEDTLYQESQPNRTAFSQNSCLDNNVRIFATETF